MNPKNLSYTKEHEWILIEGDAATVGITDYAQEELGDIVFVELPQKGDMVKTGDSPVTLESVKAVSSVYTPFDGEIIDTNNKLADEPEIINSSPFNDGWIYKIRITSEPDKDLMNAGEYEAFLENLD